MMQEVSDLADFLNPAETLFVIDAMLGQDAVNTARAFNERLTLTGVVLTKLDGDSRGGAALSVRMVTGKPIKFVGLGEKLDGFELFNPEQMAGRILGMGDAERKTADEAYTQSLANVNQRISDLALDRKSTRLNSSHVSESRMPSSA